MSEEYKLACAKTVFRQFCDALDARGWNYRANEEELTIRYAVNGEDLEMTFLAWMAVDRELIRLISTMPFKFAEDKRIDGAIVTCAATDGLRQGCFDYDLSDGKINFRIVQTYKDCVLEQSLFDYLIDYPVFIVDKYNDQFFGVNKGMISITDFVNKKYN